MLEETYLHNTGEMLHQKGGSSAATFFGVMLPKIFYSVHNDALEICLVPSEKSIIDKYYKCL